MGNLHIAEEFNPKSSVNRFDLSSEEAAIEKSIELDEDGVQYLEYARQLYFNNNQPNDFLMSNGC